MQKDSSKLVTLAAAQQPSPPQPQQLIHPYQSQQRPVSPPSPTPPSNQQRATLVPRSVSNTQRPTKDESGANNNNNAPVRRRSSVQIDNDSNISNNSSIRRRSSMMLDSDISAESRRSNASSCHRHHRSQQNNEPYQPVWLRRQTQCAACNPNPVRKSLSRSSSMYDVAGVAQQQHPRAIHTGTQQQQPNTHATTTTSSSSSQNNATPPTAAATAAAAMAAAAAVVSAAAATAACGMSTTATTLDEQWQLTQSNHDDKWMRLISSCMAQSGRLERLARDIVATEKQASSIIDSQQSMEQLMKRRDDQHHTNIRHCESLVRAQREMLNEMESLLTEYGIKKSNQQQKQPSSPTTDQHEQQRQAMTTPPPSSPSDYSSSSLPSMPPSPSSSNHNNENEENEQENVASEDVHNKEQEQASSSSSSSQSDKEQETCIQEQNSDQSNSSDKEQPKTLGDFVEDSVSRIRWTVSQWVGGSVGTGQLVKCEMGPDGQTSTIIVAGTGVTTEPKLLPKVIFAQAFHVLETHILFHST